MRRTELPPRRKPMRRSWFRAKRSPKRRAADRAMRSARVQLMDRDRHCILCDQPGQDPHHRLAQGSGGALNDPTLASLSRLVLLCRRHHDWVGRVPAIAESLGLVVRHGVTRPVDVPVWHHGRWVRLDDGGYVLPAECPSLSSAIAMAFFVTGEATSRSLR